jgi:hypothetical protein
MVEFQLKNRVVASTMVTGELLEETLSEAEEDLPLTAVLVKVKVQFRSGCLVLFPPLGRLWALVRQMKPMKQIKIRIFDIV